MSEDERQQRIRERAYALWEAEGQPSGRHDQHWHDAARALDQEPPASPPAAPAKKPRAGRRVATPAAPEPAPAKAPRAARGAKAKQPRD